MKYSNSNYDVEHNEIIDATHGLDESELKEYFKQCEAKLQPVDTNRKLWHNYKHNKPVMSGTYVIIMYDDTMRIKDYSVLHQAWQVRDRSRCLSTALYEEDVKYWAFIDEVYPSEIQYITSEFNKLSLDYDRRGGAIQPDDYIFDRIKWHSNTELPPKTGIYHVLSASCTAQTLPYHSGYKAFNVTNDDARYAIYPSSILYWASADEVLADNVEV